MPANLLNAAIAAAAALAMPMVATLPDVPREARPRVATVQVAAATLNVPLPGEFLRGGIPVNAPLVPSAVAPFRIMTHQVSLADYNRCVAARACDPADARATVLDVPVTGVSWRDAEAYARWYSARTGEQWRLPTAIEAAAAAAERFGGEATSGGADDPGNPAVRWIRQYRAAAAAKRPPDPDPKPLGHYGPNSVGLQDFGGNVWEWTSTCYSHVTLDAADGSIESSTENCGVHVLEGKHRAYMSNFVRDGRSGGCAVGTPPDNLGFRLVLSEGECGVGCWISKLGQHGWTRS